MAYCTVADVKTYLTTAKTDHDTLLAALIVRAQAWIDNRVGFSFEAAADTERTFDAIADVDGYTLTFDTWCTAITTVTNGDDTEIAATYYVTEPRNTAHFYAIRLKASSGYTWETDGNSDPEDAITIDGRWAYSTAVPDDIKHTCIRLVVYLYHQRTNQTDADRPLFADGVMALPSQIPSDILAVIDSYKWRT